MRQRNGFSLMELLITVLIIGILAAMSLPSYVTTIEKTRTSEAVAVLNAVASAQDRYFMKKGTYVNSLSNLDINISNLKYFTTYSTIGVSNTLRSVKSAPGGLGQYRITLTLPTVGGQGGRTWQCTPTSAGCNYFLPKGK